MATPLDPRVRFQLFLLILTAYAPLAAQPVPPAASTGDAVRMEEFK